MDFAERESAIAQEIVDTRDNFADPQCQTCGGRGSVEFHGQGRMVHYRRCPCTLIGQRRAVAEMVRARSFPGRLRDCTFSSFITGDNPLNEQAMTAARGYVDAWPEALAGGWALGFWGPPRAGKTHLAVAVAQSLVKRYLVRPLVIDVPSMLREERRTFNDENAVSTVDRAMAADFLVLDDIGAEYLRSRSEARSQVDWVDEQLFIILNERVNNSQPFIFTTNCAETQLRRQLSDRVWSRLERSMVALLELAPVDGIGEKRRLEAQARLGLR